MLVLKAAKDMAAFSETARKSGKTISFVPTMGALHKGHLALMREARGHGDLVVVSLFVNPRQFNDPNDFQKYARDLPRDLKKCESEAVDVAFAPPEEEIYPPNEKAPPIPLPAVAIPLEGKFRPGHFEGVVAVVSRLFRIVHPNAAVFGLKDYQQVRVIEEMVKEQGLGVAIIRHPTVRERDGLALSSRNARLTPEGQRKALVISRSLREASRLYESGERDPKKIHEAALRILRTDAAVTIDYAAVVDAVTLQEIPRIERPAVVAIAAFVEEVRLIDNCLLG